LKKTKTKQLNDIGAGSPKQLKENLNFIFTVPIDLKGKASK